jgi:hypothetical protein
MAPRPEDRFDVGADILGSTIDAFGTVTIQTGDVVAAEVISNSAAWWQQVGFVSRPAAAQAGVAAAQVVTIKQGTTDVAIASRDPRGQAIYGNLGPGDTCVYAPGPTGNGQACVQVKGSGAVTLYTTDDNTSEGNGVYLRVDPTKLAFVAPWGSLVFDASGLHVKTANGARIDLGGVAAPGPLSSLIPSYARITAGMVTLDSAACMLGPVAGTYQAACLTTAPPASKGAPVLSTVQVVPATGLVSAAPGSPVTGALTIPPNPQTTAGSSCVYIGV